MIKRKIINRIKNNGNRAVDHIITKAEKEIINTALRKVSIRIDVPGYKQGWFDRMTVFIYKYLPEYVKKSCIYNPNYVQIPSGVYPLRVSKDGFILYIQNSNLMDGVEDGMVRAFRELDITIYIFGKDRHKIKQLIDDKVYANTISNDSINIYELSEHGHMESSAMIKKSIDNIVNDNKQLLIDIIDGWKSNKVLFDNIGIVHKFGILLYGQPGTGKTSIIRALASHFNCDIVIVDPSKAKSFGSIRAFNNSNRIRKMGEGDDDKFTIVLIEDIDYLYTNRLTRSSAATKEEREQDANTQELLQLLDGAKSLPNTIIIATTNYLDRLDPVITRDGRFDLKLEIKQFEREDQIVELCNIFKLNGNQRKKVLSKIDTYPISPATVQGHILRLIMKANIPELKLVNNDKTGTDN